MTESAKTVAIIGAGIVGVSTAIWLQRDGHKVILIDRKGPGEGTSHGNGGVLASCSIVPVTVPGLLRKAPRMLLRSEPAAVPEMGLPAEARALAAPLSRSCQCRCGAPPRGGARTDHRRQPGRASGACDRDRGGEMAASVGLPLSLQRPRAITRATPLAGRSGPSMALNGTFSKARTSRPTTRPSLRRSAAPCA